MKEKRELTDRASRQEPRTLHRTEGKGVGKSSNMDLQGYLCAFHELLDQNEKIFITTLDEEERRALERAFRRGDIASPETLSAELARIEYARYDESQEDSPAPAGAPQKTISKKEVLELAWKRAEVNLTCEYMKQCDWQVPPGWDALCDEQGWPEDHLYENTPEEIDRLFPDRAVFERLCANEKSSYRKESPLFGFDDQHIWAVDYGDDLEETINCYDLADWAIRQARAVYEPDSDGAEAMGEALYEIQYECRDEGLTIV